MKREKRPKTGRYFWCGWGDLNPTHKDFQKKYSAIQNRKIAINRAFFVLSEFHNICG